jgi:hypothetical protein
MTDPDHIAAIRLPALLVPAVRERLDLAESVHGTLLICDDLGVPLATFVVSIGRAAVDGGLRQLLKEFWESMRLAEDPQLLQAAQDEWSRQYGGTVEWPPLPRIEDQQLHTVEPQENAS